MYQPSSNVTWAGYPNGTTTDTVTYTPRQMEPLSGWGWGWEGGEEELRAHRTAAEDRCCDYCGCLLPGEYRPTCSQCGAPVKGRRVSPRSPKWEYKPPGGFRLAVENPEYLEDYLDHMSRTSKGV